MTDITIGWGNIGDVARRYVTENPDVAVGTWLRKIRGNVSRGLREAIEREVERIEPGRIARTRVIPCGNHHHRTRELYDICQRAKREIEGK